MDQNRQQVAQKLKSANNLLVTVSANPTLDQLSAGIGLALFMNKLGKHTTMVFSGQVPSVIDFLHPDAMISKTADSLRDFIISLDKAKADKLRYKVEDDVVRIFITPYRSNLSQDDLSFSQGDFNVDVVIALGVDNREHLDQAIVSHGRILHDAEVVALMAGSNSTDIGSINWIDAGASSLSEMVQVLTDEIDGQGLDSQIATALLTGIVAETDRFNNEKTTPGVMTAAAKLMAAGADQQLIAHELQDTIHNVDAEHQEQASITEPEQVITHEEHPEESKEETSSTVQTEGDLANIALELTHTPLDQPQDSPVPNTDEPQDANEQPAQAQDVPVGEASSPEQIEKLPPVMEDLGLPKAPDQLMGHEDSSMHRVIQPLNSSLKQELLDQAGKPINIDELSLPSPHDAMPSLMADQSATPIIPNPFMPSLDTAQPVAPLLPSDQSPAALPFAAAPQLSPSSGNTIDLARLSEDPTMIPAATPQFMTDANIADARQQVAAAESQSAYRPEPIAALGAMPLEQPTIAPPLPPTPAPFIMPTNDMATPQTAPPLEQSPVMPEAQPGTAPIPPPPVPPPMPQM